MTHLIVFSHLRWDFVYQRPQHLLSRLAQHYDVVFIEEPVQGGDEVKWERSSPCVGVEVLRPHTPVASAGFHDDQIALLHPLIAQHLTEHRIRDYMVWFYTPMALPLLSSLSPRAVIYDCMDELAAFKNAPRQMKQRETALLKMADLVLTGGPSLYESKRSANDNTVCLPSAVDAEHYASRRALGDESAVARAEALQGHIQGPRLGFFGVIDERIDLQLVAKLADELPTHQVVMVGPVVKIDPATLPRRPNVHWLGSQPYSLLPQLVAGWDVCLMPFALNESTAFISPTKTLEYMAAGKPVVSTPVHDVRVLFGEVVEIAHDASEFVRGCVALLKESGGQTAERRDRMSAMVSRYSWDRATGTVHAALLGLSQKAAAEAKPGTGMEDTPNELSKRRVRHVAAG